MTTIAPIGSLEGRLCGHLAAALATFMAGCCGVRGDGERGLSVPYQDLSEWRRAAEILERLAVVARAEGLQHPAFTLDAGEMPDHLAGAISAGDPRVAEVVEAFVTIACGYGDDILPDERDWFDPPARYRVAMHWLARCGYAERRDDRFRWSDLVAPAMQACHGWTLRNESLTTIGRIGLQAEAERAWETMPELLRRRLLGGRFGLIDLARALAQSWKDGGWRQHDDGAELQLTGELALARELMEMAAAERAG